MMLDNLLDRLDEMLLPMFPYAFILMGALGIWAYARGRKMISKATEWPTTDGRILVSEVAESQEFQHGVSTDTATQHGGGVSISYQPRIEYEYVVRGETHTGNRIGIFQHSSNNYSEAESAIEHFGVGSTVAVYYNPKDISESLLDPDYGPGGGILLFISIAFILVGSIWVIVQ